MASYESFLLSIREFAKSSVASWPVLKLYYSAYFAAHAILRSQGAGHFRVERPQASHFNNILQALSLNYPVMGAGTFEYVVYPGGRTQSPEISFMPEKGGLGVHEGFWCVFCRFLQAQAAAASRSRDADSLQFVAGVGEIVDLILRGGSAGAWFSAIRNEINYQHRHEVWFPTKKTGKPFRVLGKVIEASSASINLSALRSEDVVTRFVLLSNYLACLNIEIADYLAARSSVGKAFGQRWRRMRRLLVVSKAVGG